MPAFCGSRDLVCWWALFRNRLLPQRRSNKMTENGSAGSTYKIRPRFEQKFRPQVAEKLIHTVLAEALSDKQYSQDLCKTWSEQIGDTIRVKLKELNLERYKYVVQVVIGEQRGEGVKMDCRCFWDSDTDNYARDIFMNESLFCVAAAFGVYHY